MAMSTGRTGSSPTPPTTTRMWASAGSAASAFRSSVSRRASATRRPARSAIPTAGSAGYSAVAGRRRGQGPAAVLTQLRMSLMPTAHVASATAVSGSQRARPSAAPPAAASAGLTGSCRAPHRVTSSGAPAPPSDRLPPVPCRRHNKAEHDRVALRARSASVAARAGTASSCSVIFEILGRIGAAAQASPGSRHRRGARGRTPAARRESDHSAAPAGVSEAASRASASSRPGHGEMAGLPGCGAGQPRPCSVGRGGQWRRSPASGRRASALVRSGPAHMLSPSLAHAPSCGFLWGWPSRRALRGVRSRRRAGAATAAGASPG